MLEGWTFSPMSEFTKSNTMVIAAKSCFSSDKGVPSRAMDLIGATVIHR